MINFEKWWLQPKNDQIFDLAGDKECCEETWKAALEWVKSRAIQRLVHVGEIERELEN